ncbi:hypothetical protein DMENIID0001_141290 [Sergentomyia squamirostris]
MCFSSFPGICLRRPYFYKESASQASRASASEGSVCTSNLLPKLPRLLPPKSLYLRGICFSGFPDICLRNPCIYKESASQASRASASEGSVCTSNLLPKLPRLLPPKSLYLRGICFSGFPDICLRNPCIYKESASQASRASASEGSVCTSNLLPKLPRLLPPKSLYLRGICFSGFPDICLRNPCIYKESASQASRASASEGSVCTSNLLPKLPRLLPPKSLYLRGICFSGFPGICLRRPYCYKEPASQASKASTSEILVTTRNVFSGFPGICLRRPCFYKESASQAIKASASGGPAQSHNLKCG